MNAHDIELALRARAAFNDSADRIDPDTRRRLRDLRLHALKGQARHARARWIWPAGMATAAALALAVFLPHLPRAPTTAISAVPVAVVQQHTTPASTTHGNTATIAENTNPGMAEVPSVEAVDPDDLGDLGFYGWLAKQQDSKTGG